jgi:hypothetical protein
MRPGAHPFDHFASSQLYSHSSPNMSYSSDPSPLGSNGPSTGAATYSLTCSNWYTSCLEAPLLANDGSDFAFPKPWARATLNPRGTLPTVISTHSVDEPRYYWRPPYPRDVPSAEGSPTKPGCCIVESDVVAGTGSATNKFSSPASRTRARFTSTPIKTSATQAPAEASLRVQVRTPSSAPSFFTTYHPCAPSTTSSREKPGAETIPTFPASASLVIAPSCTSRTSSVDRWGLKGRTRRDGHPQQLVPRRPHLSARITTIRPKLHVCHHEHKSIASSAHTPDHQGSRTKSYEDQGGAIAATPTDNVHPSTPHACRTAMITREKTACIGQHEGFASRTGLRRLQRGGVLGSALTRGGDK